MRHLILSRELPPAPYPAGGIGTYVSRVSRLLAQAGDVVHVIGQQWAGARRAREEQCEGRLVVHRVPIEWPLQVLNRASTRREIQLLGGSGLPSQAWAWNATLLAEALIETEGIDVVEAQEWEAPLYLFLLRRALGLGPAARPPCIVHLHSPTEFIWQHNEWDIGRPDYLPMRRQEEFCLAMADALVCPSHYLARQAEGHYGLTAGSVRIIPYPMGTPPVTARAPAGATSRPVVFVGRLEPRKGLVEFIEAAVAVAIDDPKLRFVFVGSDVPYRDGISMGQYLRRRIPLALRSRFEFRGPVPRAQVAQVLAGAGVAVVPSRWENFPNTCIEAMLAGVPVVVSPTGGMTEMVEDGRTGWVATSQASPDLEDALRRALRASPEERDAIGRGAQSAISSLCSDAIVTEAHRTWREQVRQAGARRSLTLPSILPWSSAPMHGASGERVAARVSPASLPAARVTSAAGALGMSQGPAAEIILVVPEGFDIDADFPDTARRVLAHTPDAGLVFGWVTNVNAQDPATCPAFPYQWLANQGSPVFAIRREALADLGADSLQSFHEPFATWALVNAILVAGWKGVTAPIVAGTMTSDTGPACTGRSLRREEMRRLVRARHQELFSRDAQVLVALAESGALDERHNESGNHTLPPDRWTGLTMRDVRGLTMRDKLALALQAIRDPARSIAWLRGHWPDLGGRGR